MILKPGKETVMAISDMQAPFEHPDSLDFLRWLRNEWSPTKIVNIGDEVDFHALSRFTKNPEGYSAGHELDAAIAHLQPFYDEFPNVMVCNSNHASRPYDRAFEAGIPERFMKDLSTILKHPPGWQRADKWVIDEVMYVHGHKSMPAGQGAIQSAATKYSRPVVFGHLHAHAGIYYYATDEDLRFAMNIGSLINQKAYAFRYGDNCVQKAIIGCGIVMKGIPIFIPMLLDEKGRWVRRQSKDEILEAAYKEMTLATCKDCGEQTQSRGYTSAGNNKRFCKDCKSWSTIKLCPGFV